MKILSVIYYQLLKNLRDIRVLAALIIFPLLMIFILGTALNGQLSADLKDKIKTGYIDLDNDVVGKGLGQLLSDENVTKYLEAKKYSSEARAKEAMSKGLIDNYIVVSPGTSALLQKDSSPAILVKGNKNVDMIESILKSFTSKYNAQMASVMVYNTPGQLKESDALIRLTSHNTKLPKSIDYYSVLTLLQVLMMGCILGTLIIHSDENSNIHIRLYALPTSKWTVIWGKVIGTSLFLFLSCVVTTIFTKYVYGANWSGNLLIIGATLLVFCAISIGVGITVGAFTKSLASGVGISFFIMFFLSCASGAVTPNSSIEVLNIINPNYFAKVLIFGSLYHYSGQLMLKSALGLGAIFVVVYSIAAIKLRRVNYDNI